MAPTRFAKRERPAARSVLEGVLDAQTRADLRDAIDRAGRLTVSTLEASDAQSFDTATAALETVTELAFDALDRSEAAPARELLGLLGDLTRIERSIRTAEISYRDNALQAAREALARLQDITSVSRLLDAGTEAVCSLGFDRAIISRIDEETWVTEALHVDGDAEWALEILEAGRSNPQVLRHGMPEYEVVRRRRPVLVTSVQQNPDVHQAIAESSQSRSYVAAPLMPSSRVIGFIHGDRYFHRDDVTAFDQDLLHLFAEGFGFALERALLLDRLDALRLEMVAPAVGTGRGLSMLIGHHLTDQAAQVAAATRPALHIAPGPDDDARLTRREMEVLRLLAGGDTNTRIARRLVISESTVKTHVKSILRKLGASNRAEAVARWHRTTRPSQG